MAFSETSSPSTFQQLSAPSGFTLMAVTSMISTYWNLPLMTPAAQVSKGSGEELTLLAAVWLGADQCSQLDYLEQPELEVMNPSWPLCNFTIKSMGTAMPDSQMLCFKVSRHNSKSAQQRRGPRELGKTLPYSVANADT